MILEQNLRFVAQRLDFSARFLKNEVLPCFLFWIRVDFVQKPTSDFEICFFCLPGMLFAPIWWISGGANSIVSETIFKICGAKPSAPAAVFQKTVSTLSATVPPPPKIGKFFPHHVCQPPKWGEIFCHWVFSFRSGVLPRLLAFSCRSGPP